MIDAPLQPDDQRLCELLDEYVAAVQAGDERSRLRLVGAASGAGSVDRQLGGS